MPKRKDINKVLIIGSGPIVIGQACEFDYSGTQAAKALVNEGCKVVLVNSNPATIMTESDISDCVYLEPLTVNSISKIIEKEKPDSLLPTVGGQTALNLAVKLSECNILKENSVKLIGANLNTIKIAEDRKLFKTIMESNNIDIPKSFITNSVKNSLENIKNFEFPVVIRPSFTLGGSGGGLAYNVEELKEIVNYGLNISPNKEVLVEEGIVGWKEFELEVVRDNKDRFIVICSIENIDPMGIHTGDSITVAPAMTLSDYEYQKMRDIAKRIIGYVGVETGGSNIQFAIHPKTGRMVVIEMNPRVSRSSALASKATGFPIAKVAAKLAIGMTLDEIQNDITKQTPASFEPSLDYIVVKIPRFDFKKFPGNSNKLGTSMHSVGEVMAIGRTFLQALQKAMRSLENGETEFIKKDICINKIKENIKIPNPERLFWIYNAIYANISIDEIYNITKIDKWFLYQIQELSNFEKILRNSNTLDNNLLKEAKKYGFSDKQIASIFKIDENKIREKREKFDIKPIYKIIDTCAAEFSSETPYFYSSYDEEDELIKTKNKKVIILGSGPNRIGQGIEFDCCCVHAVMGVKELGYDAIMINCNPETVSTDYDILDKLYFEPLVFENVFNIIQRENPIGVFVQFGGATPLSLSNLLSKSGVKILGTQSEMIDFAEDREKFGKLLDLYSINRPQYGIAYNLNEAYDIANEIGYPILVRPSYVLGGQAMAICYNDDKLEEYINKAVEVSYGKPILLDKFLENSIEVDVDALCDGKDVVICGILEHLEQAGIHSGDSIAILPSFNLKNNILDKIKNITKTLSLLLKVNGLINIQYAIYNNEVYVLEANPRASRTIPFLSKALKIPFAKIAAKVMLGVPLFDLIKEDPIPNEYFVKIPVFPFDRFPNYDPILGPEMKSTGEVFGHDVKFELAFAKAMMASYQSIPLYGTVFISVNDYDKKEIIPIVKEFKKLNFKILTTKGTFQYLKENNINTEMVFKMGDGEPSIIDLINKSKVDLVINTPSNNENFVSYYLRKISIKNNIPLITTIATTKMVINSIKFLRN